MANERTSVHVLGSDIVDAVAELVSKLANTGTETTQVGRDANMEELYEMMFQLRSTYNLNFACSGQMRKVALDQLVVDLMARLVMVYRLH